MTICTNCGSIIAEDNEVKCLLYGPNETWRRTSGCIITICTKCKSKYKKSYSLLKWKLLVPKEESFDGMFKL